MAALWNREGHYIFAFLPCGFFLSSSFFFLFSSSNLSGRWKYRIQKSEKIRHLGTIAQIVGLYLSTTGKKTAISPPHVPAIW